MEEGRAGKEAANLGSPADSALRSQGAPHPHPHPNILRSSWPTPRVCERRCTCLLGGVGTRPREWAQGVPTCCDTGPNI